MTLFDSNTFEHDYVVTILTHFTEDLKTEKPVWQVIDKYACILSSFANGQICQAVKDATHV